MSHHTTVVNATQNIYIDSCNAARQANGLTPLPAGTSVSNATKAMATALIAQVTKEWTNVYPSVSLGANTDFGFVYPTSELKPGIAIPCVVNQINMDFKNWSLPGTTDTATDITKTITEELSIQVGLMGTAHGSVQVNSNETIDWMAGYASVNISQGVGGYLYVFGSALEF
jgi:hypothetical protein